MDCFQNLPAEDMRDQSAKHAYMGQVILYPPDPCVPDDVRISASFGVVAMKQDKRNWKYFKANVPDDVARENIDLYRSEADTICRAAGFNDEVTNSVMSAQKAGVVFNYTFSRLMSL